MECLLWESLVLRLCRRPPGLLRGEELHWSFSKKANTKPNWSAHVAASHFSRKTLPLCWQAAQFALQGVRKTHKKHRNHRAWTTSEWHQWKQGVHGSAEPRPQQNDQRKSLPTTFPTPPTPSKAPGWQKLRLSKFSPGGDFPPLWVRDSKLPRGLEQLHFCTLSYSCANCSPQTPLPLLGCPRLWGFLVSQAHQAAGTASSEKYLDERL